MRSIRIGVPSGTAKLVLWQGTEDEEAFEIKSAKRGVPYVMAHGIRYELTEEEIKQLRLMQKVASSHNDAKSQFLEANPDYKVISVTEKENN